MGDHLFRVPIFVALSLAIAFAGGIAFTLYALNATAGFGSIRLGAWEAFPALQMADADPYAKSHRAKTGELLYGSAEGLVFTAKVDDQGQPLTAGCRYRITGQTPPARLWTLYTDGDGTPPPGTDQGKPSALNSWTILRNSDSSFTIDVAARAMPGNWLAVPQPQAFKLVLTLFDTPTAGSSGLVDLSMPKLERTGCGNA